jgi:hypothetical protein
MLPLSLVKPKHHAFFIAKRLLETEIVFLIILLSFYNSIFDKGQNCKKIIAL